MKNAPYSGAYSRRKFSNYSAASKAVGGLSATQNDDVPNPQPPVCTAKVAWNGKMGRVNGNGLVLYTEAHEGMGAVSAAQGSSVTLTASPLAGYRFVKWHGAPVEGKTSPEVTFQMNADCSIAAEFAAVDPGTGGAGGVVVGPETPEKPSSVKKDSAVAAFVKKWWWALLIAAYVIYKEGGSK